MSVFCSCKFVILAVTVLLLAATSRSSRANAHSIGSNSDDSSQSQWPRTAHQRIQSPCAGEEPVSSQLDVQQQQSDVSSSGGVTGMNGLQQQRRHLQAVKSKLESLQHDVLQLKRNYVSSVQLIFYTAIGGSFATKT